jgi:CDP-diglyceride synthetase
MLQRIQTVFLLIALVLQALVLFQPLAYLQVNDTTFYEIYARGYLFNNQIQHSYVLLLACALSFLLTLVIIFLFKKRIVQMRLAIYNFILLIAMQGVFAYVIYGTASNISAEIYLQYASILPVISAMLHILAFRYIKRDEELVKAADRIR